MASICALEMRLVLGVEDVRVTTFGSPRVGNDKFHSLFDRVLKRTRRFTHNNDIVPSVPTVFMGFQHVATEVRTGCPQRQPPGTICARIL